MPTSTRAVSDGEVVCERRMCTNVLGDPQSKPMYRRVRAKAKVSKGASGSGSTSDCLDVLRGMAANSIDAVVCDPPYGLAFMGKLGLRRAERRGVGRVLMLKPGGHFARVR